MTLRTAVLAPLAAALLLALPAAAQAGDAECLWVHVPQAERDAYLDSYIASGGKAPVQIKPESLEAGYTACKYDVAKLQAIGQAFGSLEQRMGAATYLQRKKGVSEDAMVAAFGGLPEADRFRFARGLTNTAGNLDDAEKAFLRGVVNTMAVKLGIADDPDATRQLLIYFIAIIRQTQAEKLF